MTKKFRRDETALSPAAAQMTAAIRARQADDARVMLTFAEASALLNVGITKLYRLIDAGELPSALDQGRRRILAAACYDRLVRISVQSNPLGASTPPRATWSGLSRRKPAKPARRSAAPKLEGEASL
jgi:excisionase family DNA binding protein